MNDLLRIAAVLLVAAPLAAADFDQGVGLSGFPGNARPEGRAYEPGCADIAFPAGDPAPRGAYLESWELVCNGAYGARYGGEGYGGEGRGGQGPCRRERGHTMRGRGVSVALAGPRAPRPWETETFRACLEGDRLDVYPVETAYEYRRAAEDGPEHNSFVFVAGRRTPMKPDADGIAAALDASLRATLTDRWAAEYAGEAVEVRYALKEGRGGWFDSTAAEGSFVRPVAATYAAELPAARLRPGHPYYLEFKFRRIGTISRDSFTRGRKSAPVVYTP